MGCVPDPLAATDMPAASAAAPAQWARRARWASLLLAPSATVLRRWALAGVITSALIILSGAAVRLAAGADYATAHEARYRSCEHCGYTNDSPGGRCGHCGEGNRSRVPLMALAVKLLRPVQGA